MTILRSSRSHLPPTVWSFAADEKGHATATCLVYGEHRYHRLYNCKTHEETDTHRNMRRYREDQALRAAEFPPTNTTSPIELPISGPYNSLRNSYLLSPVSLQVHIPRQVQAAKASDLLLFQTLNCCWNVSESTKMSIINTFPTVSLNPSSLLCNLQISVFLV